MAEPVTAEWLAERLSGRTIRGIAIETRALIRAGVLPLGAKLPPIRDLAFSLGVSPASLSEAWSELRKQKIITGRGRNGTWVSGDKYVAKPARLSRSGNYGETVLDLTKAVPDTKLLPGLSEALAHGARAEGLNSYRRERILGELEEAVRINWPYEPDAFLAANGGFNAVYTLLHAAVVPGSTVAIENPTAMRLLDILEDLGVDMLPVECDEQGPLPESLTQALASKPSAFIFQPRLNSVTGQTVSSSRLAQLGDVLEGGDTLIIEDDGLGDISSHAPQSLGSRFPDRVVHILSYSKTLGPDLRLAVLSGSSAIVEQIQSYRAFSSGWTSRILQGAVAWFLRDPGTQDTITRAREVYQERRDSLRNALEQREVHVQAGAGLSIWSPVKSEHFALVTLAARGIAVHPGSKYSINQINHIRIATSNLSDRCEEVADAVALATSPDGDFTFF